MEERFLEVDAKEVDAKGLGLGLGLRLSLRVIGWWGWVAALLLSMQACRFPQLISKMAEQEQADVLPAKRWVSHQAYRMGTRFKFTAWTADADAAKQAFERALEEVHRLEVLMTTWVHPTWPQSDVMRVNKAAGQDPVSVSEETYQVIQAAVEMSRQSEGLFDITVGALGGLWRFDEDLTMTVPSYQAVSERLRWVGFGDIQLDPGARRVGLKRPGMRITLGGIAKGYAVDACARLLRSAGLSDFLVQAGGDLYVAGQKATGPWKVGIRDPRDPNPTAYFAVAPIRDHAFSTAGDYERAFVKDGRRYHHILDPRTGYPATASRSVTIFAPTALWADSLDDAVFILGPKKGLQLVERLPGVGAVIVDAQNHLWVSKRLQGVVHILHPPTDGL